MLRHIFDSPVGLKRLFWVKKKWKEREREREGEEKESYTRKQK